MDTLQLKYVFLFLLLFWGLEKGVASAQQTDDHVDQAAITYEEGFDLYKQGEFEQALPKFEEALALYKQSGDYFGQAMAYYLIGLSNTELNRPEIALDAYDASLQLFSEHTDVLSVPGLILNDKGDLLFHQLGEYELALAVYQQSLFIWQKLNEVELEGSTLHRLGRVYSEMGQHALALSLYEQVLPIVRQANDLFAEATTLHNMGYSYGELGDYEQGLLVYKQALSIRRGIGDKSGEGSTLHGIGRIYQNQSNYREALNSYKQAILLLQDVHNQQLVGVTYYNIGLSYTEQGQYSLAESAFGNALNLAKEIKDQESEASALRGFGVLYTRQGQHTLAEERLNQALQLQQAIGDRTGEAVTLNDLGHLYLAQVRYGEAFIFYQRAYNVLAALEGAVGKSAALHNMGLVYYGQGRFEEALATFEQSLTMAELLRKEDIISTLNSMALAYDDIGQEDEALARYDRALSLAEQIRNRDQVANILSNMGAVYHELGRIEEAAEILQRSVSVSRQTGNWLHLAAALNNLGAVYEDQGKYSLALMQYNQALQLAQSAENEGQQGVMLANIGQIYEYLNDPHQALSYYENAIAVFDNARANAGSDIGRSAFFDLHVDLYTHAANLYFQQGRLEEAFLTSERGRARAFLDSLITDSIQLSDNEAAELLTEEAVAYYNWQALQSYLATARLSGKADETEIQELEAQVAAAKAAHTVILSKVAEANESLLMLISMRKAVPTLAETQAALSESDTLLSYFVVSKDKTLVFILTKDSFTAKALTIGSQDLVNIVGEFINTEIIAGYKLLPGDYVDTAQYLYSHLIAPLRSEITTDSLIIVPHRQLHYLPFAALLNGEEAMIDEFALSFLPSAGTLSLLPEEIKGSPGIGALVMGNPTGVASLPNLPAAQLEAEAIAALYDVDAALNGAATESLIKEQARNAGILHLAVHGKYDTQNPLATTLYLAEDDANDGRLQVNEVFGLSLNEVTSLVVLSACQTNVGKLSDGDELVGLTRALFMPALPPLLPACGMWMMKLQHC